MAKTYGDFDQPVSGLPARPHLDQRPADLFCRDLSIRPSQHASSLAFGQLEQRCVADDVGTESPRASLRTFLGF